jgi:hypothetical protein
MKVELGFVKLPPCLYVCQCSPRKCTCHFSAIDFNNLGFIR